MEVLRLRGHEQVVVAFEIVRMIAKALAAVLLLERAGEREKVEV